MKKLLISFVLVFTGCVGVWHGNPYGEQTREGTDITRKRGTETPWWQKRQEVAPTTSACVCSVDSHTKWDLESFDSVLFPKDWEERHPWQPETEPAWPPWTPSPSPTPKSQTEPLGEVY